jgi:DNA-binding NtrC family response regulator
MKVRSLLLVDDDPAVLQYLSCVLDDGGFQTRTAADGAACMDCVNRYPIDLVITDLVLRGAGDGLAIIRALKQSHPDLPVILMSGAAQGGFADAAKRLGAAAILQKPVDPVTLLGLVEEVLRKSRAKES